MRSLLFKRVHCHPRLLIVCQDCNITFSGELR
jgi:hypothetical protein